MSLLPGPRPALSPGPWTWASAGPHQGPPHAPIMPAQLARGLSSAAGRSVARVRLRPAGYHPTWTFAQRKAI